MGRGVVLMQNLTASASGGCCLKEIQEALSPAEKIELAGLTGIMREHLDSEANVPMEGAKALHRKLLELAAEDEPS